MLSIVATPIGNLGDITLRALEALKTCDAIVCEDTRVTGMLLKHLTLEKKELIAFHGYTDKRKIDEILRRLDRGDHLVLVSDAGTPGISDPGYAVVSAAAAAGARIEAVPGAAAFLAALSVSGMPVDKFVYLGFLPLKKGRRSLLASLASEERTVVFYESVHRIEKTLSELATHLASTPDRHVAVCRELTKLHEEVVRTTVEALPAVAQRITKKGEFAVVIGAMHARHDRDSLSTAGDCPEDEES